MTALRTDLGISADDIVLPFQIDPFATRGRVVRLGPVVDSIARQGNEEALRILFDVGIPSQDPLRAPVTLAIGLVALRNTPLLLKTLQARADQDAARSYSGRPFSFEFMSKAR